MSTIFSRLRQNWLLFVLLLLGLFLLAQPAGFLSALSQAFAEEYEVRKLDVPTNETREFIIEQEVFAYAFRWQGGLFEVGVNSNSFTTVQQSVDLSNEEKAFSELYFGLERGDTLRIKNYGASNIELMLINPDQKGDIQSGQYSGNYTGAGLGSDTVVNLESGADYSELNIINRQQWRADESLATWEPRYKNITGIIVHHTAWPNDPNGDYPRTVRAIYLFHTQGRGWGDIGYNYLIDPNGNIYEGRKGGGGAIAAHTGGKNGGNIGISLMGDFSYNPPTIEQQRSLVNLIGERAILHGLDLNWQTNVTGHRDWNATSCPGEELYKIMPNIVQSARQYVADRTAGPLAQARTQARVLTINYTDTRLRIEFTDEALSQATPEELLPARSGIVHRTFDDTGATVAVESIPGYSGDWSDDTVYRMRDLSTFLLLDENVESVSRVSDQVYPTEFTPEAEEEIDYELLDNPLVRYAGPIMINRALTDGEGAPAVFQLINADSNELVEEIPVTNTEKAQIFYNRHINLYFDHEYEEGASYRVNICEGCLQDVNLNVPLPAVSWEFEVKITNFTPIYRFWSDNLAAHFYTASPQEKRNLETDQRFTSVWRYEKPGFLALSTRQCSKGSPVYRFWSPAYANHFYTINYGQYQKVLNDPNLRKVWNFEGIAFCAYDYRRRDTQPVYRFWSDTYQGHFYTISPTERDRVIERFPDNIWRYEQIAFYAMPAN